MAVSIGSIYSITEKKVGMPDNIIKVVVTRLPIGSVQYVVCEGESYYLDNATCYHTALSFFASAYTLCQA